MGTLDPWPRPTSSVPDCELAKGLEPSTPCLQGVWDFVPTPS